MKLARRAALAALALAAAPNSSLAQPVVDQSFTAPWDLGSSINDCCAFIGQTYTAGATGTLAGISIDVTAFGAYPMHVAIRTVSNGLPTTTILGEVTLGSGGSGLSDLIVFPQPIPQGAGLQYAIVVDYPGAPPSQEQGLWAGATGNAYPGGDLVFSLDGGLTWRNYGPNTYDLHFKTFLNPPGPTLSPGDVFVTDVQSRGTPDLTPAVIRVDRGTGAQTLVSSGGLLKWPLGITVSPSGDILVVDPGSSWDRSVAGQVIRIDPATGAQTVVSTLPPYTYATGIAVEPTGAILVTESYASQVVRIDPTTGVRTAVSLGGAYLRAPRGIAVAPNGDILVTDVGPGQAPGDGAIVRIDPAGGEQTLISAGGYLAEPTGLAILDNGDVLVTESQTGGDFSYWSSGSLILVDHRSGQQTLVSRGGVLIHPQGLALAAGGTALVVDPLGGCIVSPAGDGCHFEVTHPVQAVLRINPANGAVITVSKDDRFFNPTAITVVPGELPPVPPTAICQDVTLTPRFCSAHASIDGGSHGSSGSEISLAQSPPGPYGVGSTRVTLTATDLTSGASSTCEATVTVKDSVPPSVGKTQATPAVLWPPNHKMVDVAVGYSASDNCTRSPACALSVTSNEASPTSDWEVLDSKNVRLRAERDGTGSGRVYTIPITCSDRSGNSTTRSVTVTVPHDQGQ